MKTRFFSLILILCLASACVQNSPQPAAPTDPPSTNTPLPTETLVPTATSTPLPTKTPTPTPTDTPTPTATPNKTATMAAKATQTAEAVIKIIMNDLEPYKISIDQGSLAFYDKDGTTINAEGYNVYYYDNQLTGDLDLANYILKADIGWESTTGLAGCGIIFRSGDDIEKDPQYVFNAMRLSGVPAWDLEYLNNGKFESYVTNNVRYSYEIDLKQGAVNHYVIVVKGNQMTVYANGKEIGSGQSDTLTHGRFAFKTWQESGKTTCTFSDMWIWELP